MPATGRNRTRRSSFLGRLRKPFSLGRLRRRGVIPAAVPVVQSPTSVGDWQDPPPLSGQQHELNVTTITNSDEQLLHLEDVVIGTEARYIDDGHSDNRVVLRELKQQTAGPNDTLLEEEASTATPNKGSLLRDFSSPRNTSGEDVWDFRPVSPMSLGSDDGSIVNDTSFRPVGSSVNLGNAGADVGEQTENDNMNDKKEEDGQQANDDYKQHDERASVADNTTLENESIIPQEIPAGIEIEEESKGATLSAQNDDDALSQAVSKTPTIDNDGNNNDAEEKRNEPVPTDDEVPESQGKLTPEELFHKGEIIIVDIVKGKYKKCAQGRIVDIQKSVKVCILGATASKPETETEHWLPRTSLSYMGEPFPAAKTDDQEEGASNNQRTRKAKEEGATRAASPESQSSEEDHTSFSRGDRVAIVGGSYKGKNGKVLQVQKRVKVIMDESRKEAWLDKKSLQMADSSSSASPTASQSSDFYSCDETTQPEQKARAPKARSKKKGTPKARSKKKSSLTPSEYLRGDTMRLADSDKGGARLGGLRRRLVKMRFQLEQHEDTLLAHWFQSRIRIVEIPINEKELKEPFPSEFEENGSKFELAVSKVQSDGDIAAPSGAPSKKCVQLYYCQVSGPGLQTISLQKEFERIADFSSLGPKVCARLELFLSPAYKLKKTTDNKTHAIHMINFNAFCEINETGNEGCGFISGDLLVELLGGGIAAERAYAIQVRGSTAFGMFKGVLMKKIIEQGEPPIQIPSSMIVVGPSRAGEDRRESGFLVINRNGVHPNSTNAFVDRFLKGTGTTLTFRNELKKKKLSGMIVRLLLGLGVPEVISSQYKKECLKEETLRHAFVVGLADPTASLPPGSVFVPGLDHSGDIFITRSPCLEAADARMVPVVSSKPPNMSDENWAFLQSLSFGSVVFANPKPGETPMPVMIADGDLDGDLYFLTWHLEILEHVKVLPFDPTVIPAESKRGFPPQENWFAEAQDSMLDARSSQLLGQIIGKLWSKAKKIAEITDDFTNNCDYKAFAAGYKEALKIGKHGGKVYLPARLHSQLPEKFHYVLTDTKDKE